MSNTTIADCNISLYPTIPDVSTFISVLLHYLIPSVERSGGQIKRLYGGNDQEEKNAQKRTKYHGFLEKTENRAIYYYKGQIKKTTMKKSGKPNSANSYSDALLAGLIERYGEVDENGDVQILPEWYYLMDTFKMQYKLQKECEKQIQERGLCEYSDNGAKRHPLLTTLKELVSSNMRILNVIGANPYYKERCKPKEQNNEDISAEDFISALTSNSYEGEE